MPGDTIPDTPSSVFSKSEALKFLTDLFDELDSRINAIESANSVAQLPEGERKPNSADLRAHEAFLSLRSQIGPAKRHIAAGSVRQD